MSDQHERCDDPSCLTCYPAVTRTGKVLTGDDLDQLAAEASSQTRS